MEISCNIIRDLLPLYAEEMVSDDSKKMVDDHLCGCDDCTKELAVIKKVPKVPLEVDVKSLKRVGDSIRRRRVLAALAAVMTVLTLGITVCIYLFTPYYLTAEEAIEGVELREDGGLAIDYARGITGNAGYGHLDENNWGILCNTTRYDWYMGRKKDAELAMKSREELEAAICQWYDIEECTQKDWDRMNNIYVDYGTFITKDGEHLHSYNPETWTEENGEWVYKTAEKNHWYLNPSNGDVETILWDAGQDYPDSILMTTTNAYAIIFYGSMILAVLVFLASWYMKGIGRELALRMVILCGSVAFATLFVTGGQLVCVMLYNWKEAIIAESVFVSLTSLVWYQIYRLNREG